MIVSTPLRLTGVPVAALAGPPDAAAAPALQLFAPQVGPPPELGPFGVLFTGLPPNVPPPAPPRSAGLQIKITARLFNLTTDEKTRTGVRIPNAATVVLSGANGVTEYRHRVSADAGFRITSLEASTTSINNIDSVNTVKETDDYGVTAESIIWNTKNSLIGDAAKTGYYYAELYIKERRPQGTEILNLTGNFNLQQDNSVLLSLTPEQVSRLDVLQLVSSDGRVVVEIQKDSTKTVPELGWWLSLKRVNRGLVLQTSTLTQPTK